MQTLLTNVQQRTWEWQEDQRDGWVPGFFNYQTTFLASPDERTALNVGKQAVVARERREREGEYGAHVVAALLLEEMKDMRWSVCFENCEAEFRYPGCIRQ